MEEHMNTYTHSPFEFTLAQLDRELIARGAPPPGLSRFTFTDTEGTWLRKEIFRHIEPLYHPPHLQEPNPALEHFSQREIMQKMRKIIEESTEDYTRGTWGSDDRQDFFEIEKEQVRRNTLATATACKVKDLEDEGNGFHRLRTKHYGECFNLCPCENFYNQPITMGITCTGVLVAPDVVATAAHYADEGNVTGLRFVFDYVMIDPLTPAIRIPDDHIYRGVNILHRVEDTRGENATGSDWALVQLDREVTGREPVTISKKNVYYEEPIYAIGFPCGLPQKYAPGAVVDEVTKAYFMSKMDVYSGNSGSPVFDKETHELVGIVARVDCRDFRWVDDCVVSVVYPDPDIYSEGARIIKAREFLPFLES